VFFCALLYALAGPAPPLRAQDTETGFFYIERVEEKVRFIQHIIWERREYAYRYEVTIERQSAAGFSQILQEFTEENFIEVSLAAGRYRYRIVVYDLFDSPGEASQWTEFDVHLALRPEIQRFSPDSFWLDEDTVWVLSLEGRNFAQGAEVYLRPQEGPDDMIIPVEYVPAAPGGSARLVFDMRNLTPGLYDVYIENPGGLESALGTFRIAYRKPFDINFSLGCAPLIPLYGDLNAFFDQQIFPLAAAARISFVPFKRVWGYLGVELAPFWAYLSMSGQGYELAAQYMGAHLNALFQKWFANRIMAFNFRLGAGMVLLDDLHFEFSAGKSVSLQTLMPSLGAGLSFMWFIQKPFFVELGAEYMHFFSADPVSPGYLRPILGGGWQY
jgi:hypothetical protein